MGSTHTRTLDLSTKNKKPFCKNHPAASSKDNFQPEDKIDLKATYLHILEVLSFHYSWKDLSVPCTSVCFLDSTQFTKALALFVQLLCNKGISTFGSSERIPQNRVFCIRNRLSSFYKPWDGLSIGEKRPTICQFNK